MRNSDGSTEPKVLEMLPKLNVSNRTRYLKIFWAFCSSDAATEDSSFNLPPNFAGASGGP